MLYLGNFTVGDLICKDVTEQLVLSLCASLARVFSPPWPQLIDRRGLLKYLALTGLARTVFMRFGYSCSDLTF